MRQPAPGMTLHERYVLQRRIGEGGMAEVWQAHDRRLDRPVAVKLIPGASEAQIRQEAQAAAGLIHPNIAGIHDFGEIGHGADGYGYLVMELLTGPSLADRIAGGPLPWPDAARIAAEVARALAAAHAQGIVHRDIKPANIMLTGTGVKVCDFGIAAATYQHHDRSVIAGTPGYAAPERLAGGPPDPACDVYSLAVVVVEMVGGGLPRAIHTWAELANADFTRPVTMPAGIDARVAQVLATALETDPVRRPTAAALAVAFDPRIEPPIPMPQREPSAAMVAPTLVTARPAAGMTGVAAVPPPRPAPTSIADPALFHPGRSPWRVAMIAVIVLVALIATLFGYSALHRSTGTPDAASTTPAVVASTPAASPQPSVSPQPSASPSPSATDVDQLLATLSQTIQTASDDGRLDHGQAKDLSRRVQRIQRAWSQQDLGEFRDQCRQLRDDLQHGGGDHQDDQGGTDSTVVQAIDTIIDQLLAAAE